MSSGFHGFFFFYETAIIKHKPTKWFSDIQHCNKLSSKVGGRICGWPEGSLFDGYYTKVYGRALLHSLNCSTLLLTLTISKEASSCIFWVFGMTRPGIEPRSPGPLANTLTITLYIYIYVCVRVCVCVCVWWIEFNFWRRLFLPSGWLLGKSFISSFLTPAMGKYKTLGSITVVKLPKLGKENFELKPALFCLKLDFVSHPFRFLPVSYIKRTICQEKTN